MRNITLNTPAVSPSRHVNLNVTALRFQPVTLSAVKEINELLALSRTRANDFSIGGILMWTNYFNYEYCIYGDTLFIKGVSELHPELPAFSLPVGLMPLQSAVKLIKDYCRVNRIPLRFSAVPDDRIAELQAIVSGHTEPLTDWSDYIYDARSLANLPGKRYNKKRNHINRFLTDNPEYSTESIDRSNIGEIKQIYTRWISEREADTASAAEESLQTIHVINNFEQYPFEGLLLRDNTSNIVAFTIGELINDTFFTHIEKIDYRVPGAGETINKLFAQHILEHHPNVKYINREEDAGDEGLRKAKLSYHPAIIMPKYDLFE